MWIQTLARARDFVDLEKISLDRAMREAAPWAKGELVDVGCGDKPYEPMFRPYVSKYVGLESSDSYGSSENALKGKADVLYSGDRMPFDDASFDTALSNQVVEHVPDPDRFFAELVRVLRPGGRLIVTVPFSYRVHLQPLDFHRFTRFALEHYARKHDLHVDILRERGGFWSVIGQKLTSRMALRGARMGGAIQRAGGFGYEGKLPQHPRYWALPFLAPAMIGVAAVTRALDVLDHDPDDTIGYLLVATKGR